MEKRYYKIARKANGKIKEVMFGKILLELSLMTKRALEIFDKKIR